nr:MAG TPA: Nucleoid-associated protein [Siphoviridae sp. ctIkM22]
MVDIYAHFGGSLAIGRRGENEARRVVFDLSAWRRHYGEGTVQLLHQRAGDESPYPCALTVEGDTAYWLIRAADVDKPGWGEAQLHYYVGDTLAKSAIWRTVTADALGDPSEPPEDPARAWFAAIRKQIGDLEELTTEAKDNLVAAINEAAKSGSGAGSISMRVSDGYIQYSTNGGTSWDNLIATADLRGPKGDSGTDGITPHIGDNGNWYLDDTDTGKPSRGKTGPQGPAGPAGADGKDGGQGPKGDSGDDYVLTAADKAEIVQATLAALPTWTGGSY